MEKILESVTDTIKENWKNLSEIAKERLLSPMYFYFIIAWLITNWYFVFIILFENNETILKEKKIIKSEYLTHFYNYHEFSSWWMLLIYPAISAWFAMWILNLVSEKFYKRYEEYKKNKRQILKIVKEKEVEEDKIRDLEGKTKLVKKRAEIIENEYKKRPYQYEDNEEFNNSIDDEQDLISVSWILLKPSEILYNNDFEAYKAQLEEWISEQGDRYIQNKIDTERWK